MGEKDIAEALRIAKEHELDLVEVAPNVNPPVCKIMDYGKYLYKQQKAQKKHRAQQKKTETKGVRLSFRISEHDMEVKAKQARRFLEKSMHVKVILQFRGREINYIDMGKEKLMNFYKMVEDLAAIEQTPKKQGYCLFMILKPNN